MRKAKTYSPGSFQKITNQDIPIIKPYYQMRINRTCDSVFLDSYLWKDYYNVRYSISESGSLYLLLDVDGETFAALPFCSEDDLVSSFEALKKYFNEELKKPLKIYLADEESMEILKLDEREYYIEELRDSADYLYDADALRRLPGKKLRKKKNHINAFLREYGDRYEYKTIGVENRLDAWKFLERWRLKKGEEVEEHLEGEIVGIHEILKNQKDMSVRTGAVYIDGEMEAFTIGSYNPLAEMAIIHIEKANPDIRGLYPFINQQFLIQGFPEAKLVNREDDLGLEGLRKAKLSYEPIGFAKKYRIIQRMK